MGCILDGDVEAEACGEQGPAHVGEGEEQECAAAERVWDGVSGLLRNLRTLVVVIIRTYSPDRRPGEQEVDDTESPGGEQSPSRGGAGLLKDGGRVEGDDVDCEPGQRTVTSRVWS